VAESLNAGIGKGGELFAKRRQRAENWVVDETSIGQAKPSAFADKFMQEQTQQQLAFQQQKQLEQQQREKISQQQISQQQQQQFQQQQESKQTFIQQQQIKQEQSLEIRRQQEEQLRMAEQQQMELPPNYKHTDLKARSFTPSLDLGVHNVQGINVWANTAPRGWSTSYQRTKATPPKSNPPTVSVCPATPSVDTEVMQQRMQETRIAEQEEQMRMQQEQQMQMEQQEQIRIQEEQMRLQQQQEEMRRQQEEQIRIQQQKEQEMMMQRQQEEQMRIQQQQEEQRRIQQQQEEQMRIQQQQEEQMRIQRQQEEQMRIQQQQEEQRRIQEEQIRIQQQQEEQRRIQQQQEEQMRIQQQQEEQMRIQRQQEEQMRIQQQQEEQRRIQMQQEEQMRMQQQQEMERQQQMMIQQQSMTQTSSSSTTTKSGAIDEDLEDQKRREYEEWFKSQEREALEYSACVNYQEKASEVQNVTKTTTTVKEITQQQSISQQQQSSQQTVHNSSMSGTTQGFAVESRPEPVIPESQLAQPPMSNSSLFESSQSQSFAQQSSSVQQSSSSFSQSQSSKEVYESQQFSGGVMKGYTLKQDQSSNQRETGEKMLNSGVFGGIGADNNSLVDSEVDYKKHTVKDLAKHFALVKPKADIPHAILPEQRIYNGDQGPALNYLGASAQGSTSSTQSFMKKEISQEDFEASKKAYEAKKKQQQMEAQQSQSSSSQSTVVKRTETSTSSEQKSMLNERRQSLTTSLMLDPAAAHAESGIIDPSAILRGSDASGIRSRSEGLFGQTTEAGETDKILNKWDNHNAIARGWGGVKENYHPVTFRGIYNVDSQKNFTTQNL